MTLGVWGSSNRPEDFNNTGGGFRHQQSVSWSNLPWWMDVSQFFGLEYIFKASWKFETYPLVMMNIANWKITMPSYRRSMKNSRTFDWAMFHDMLVITRGYRLWGDFSQPKHHSQLWIRAAAVCMFRTGRVPWSAWLDRSGRLARAWWDLEAYWAHHEWWMNDSWVRCLIDWLISCSYHDLWLDWWIDWLVSWLVDWLFDWLTAIVFFQYHYYCQYYHYCFMYYMI